MGWPAHLPIVGGGGVIDLENIGTIHMGFGLQNQQKSLLHTSWPNEPTEPDANRSRRLRKIIKFLHNVP